MAYESHDGLPSARRSVGSTWEYRLYFTVILLLIALPISILRSTAAQAGSDAHPSPGVVTAALSEARIITATIFSA